MIKNDLVSKLLEKCYTKEMKNEKDNDEIENDVEECNKLYKECQCQEKVQEAFFGVNYK